MLVAATAASGSVVMADAGDVGVSLAVDSKYMWRGFDVYDDHGIYSGNLNVDLGSGFAFDLWGGGPIGSGNEEGKEVDYTFSYAGTCGEGETGQVNYGVFYTYYDFIQLNSLADVMEVGITIGLPNVFQIAGSPVSFDYLLAHGWSDEGVFDSGQYQDFKLSSTVGEIDVALNLGHWARFAGLDNDASHFGVTLGTSLELSGYELSPYIAFQHSMDDLVNDDDEVWGGISLEF